MKIAMMTNNYKPFIAGVPISIERLADSLRELGHQVVVFAPEYEEQEAEVDIIRYSSLLKGIVCGFSLPNCFDSRIEREFKKGNFDVIHVHHPMLIGKTALYLSKKYGIPLVFTYHTRYEQYLHYLKASALKGMMPYYLKSFLNQCDTVIAPTPKIENYLEKIGTTTRIEVLPTGLPDKAFCPEEEKSEKLRESLKGNKTYLFCTISRLAKEKNIDFLLHSLALRKARGKNDFRFVIIGEGPCRNRLENKIKSLYIEENVIFAGKVANKEIKNYCRASDLFLFASQSETQGIVLLESMAAGTPVLSLKATGVEDVVVNGKNGYMTEPSEVIFLERMNQMLEDKNHMVLEKGSLETAEQYHADNIAKTAANYYDRAIFQRKQQASYEETKRYGILFKNVFREDLSWKHTIF